LFDLVLCRQAKHWATVLVPSTLLDARRPVRVAPVHIDEGEMTKKESGSRRELEPVHTKGYMHLPHLREKLEWLYGYHPFVNTNEIGVG
jgi:hypothetical protein